LTNNCQDCELNAYASGQAAFPHLKAGIGIAPFDGSADGVVPDVHDTIPANKDTIKECHKFKEWELIFNHQPLDQRCREGDEYESNVQTDEQLIRRITIM